MDADRRTLTEQVRAALVEAALSAYEDAGMRGLCAEGAWEVAVSAMRSLDISRIVGEPPTVGPAPQGRAQRLDRGPGDD